VILCENLHHRTFFLQFKHECDHKKEIEEEKRRIEVKTKQNHTGEEREENNWFISSESTYQRRRRGRRKVLRRSTALFSDQTSSKTLISQNLFPGRDLCLLCFVFHGSRVIERRTMKIHRLICVFRKDKRGMDGIRPSHWRRR
jgi:hypothetical protein